MLEYAGTQVGGAQKTRVDVTADVAAALVTMIVLERCAQFQSTDLSQGARLYSDLFEYCSDSLPLPLTTVR